jgi:glycerol-3-phosphate dehydrogenase (NAD(P)+)
MAEKVSVIGSGSWATAIVKILSENGHDVHWWVRNEQNSDYIQKFGHNPNYLSVVEFDLPANSISSNLPEIWNRSELILLAVPSYYFKDSISSLPESNFKNKRFVSAIKGIIQDGNYLISQFLNNQFDIPSELICNVSGPCHAEEVAAEKLSYLTFASPDIKFASDCAGLFSNRYIKTHSCTDLIGTEYAAVLKNVYALAAGISVGIGYGDNFRAVLISNSMKEMKYFLQKIVNVDREILSSPYLGDTLVTAYSQHSRNRSFGLMIGRGYSINAAKLELNMVAEGYFSTKSLKAISGKAGIKLPILDAVFNILYEGATPETEMHILAESLS